MRRYKTAGVALAGAVLASAGLAAAAQAAEPPAAGHLITSFPSRDFVSAEGYAAGVPAVVQVSRRNSETGLFGVVSRSTNVTPQDDPATPGFDGIVEVNHPGAGCWIRVTPNIQPGDKVRVFQRNADGTLLNDDTTITAGVKVGPPQVETDALGRTIAVIRGSAPRSNLSSGLPLEGRIPIDQLEVRWINGDDFATSGRRDLRAPETAYNSTLRYDTNDSTSPYYANFTARVVIRPVDRAKVLAAESRGLWLGRVPATENELTIMENSVAGFPGGPETPCTAPLEGTTGAQSPVKPDPSLVPPPTFVRTSPSAGHTVIPFPSRDFVSAEGYPRGATLWINVFRPDPVSGIRELVGHSETTVSTEQIAEVNHPGGGCWVGQTPNIRAGDVVRVTRRRTLPDGTTDYVAEETAVRNVVASKVLAPAAVPGRLVVNGHAATAGTEAAPAGSPIPIDQLEQRIVNGDRFSTGERTYRAPGEGSLRYVTTTTDPYDWRAIYENVPEADRVLAVNSESRGMWLGANPLAENELTIFETGGDEGLPTVPGAPYGPVSPCTAPSEAS